MNRLAFTLLFLFSLSSPAEAQSVGEGGGGIVKALNGDGLLVQVPKGWILDNRAMAKQGIDMLFYPAELGFHGLGPDTPVFAYVMPTVKGASYVTVQSLIDMRDKQIHDGDKLAKTVIEQAAKLNDQKTSTVTIVKYDIPSLPRFERVAYLEDDRTIYELVLSTSSEQELNARSAFMTDVIENHKRLISDTAMSAPDQAPNKPTHVSITFEGETVADKGLFSTVSKYIFDHRKDTTCQSFERVAAKSMPLATTGGFPKRGRPDYVKDDVYENWEVTMCGAVQENLVRFSYPPDGSVIYWINQYK
ncbi:MAG TPA: hypothetical protein VFW00_06375 [Rhodocyclaceae bacterium]|nr:hypothetical protein [Rhodocyclaceae bacterium]